DNAFHDLALSIESVDTRRKVAKALDGEGRRDSRNQGAACAAKPDARDPGVQRTGDVGLEAVADHAGLPNRNAEPSGALGIDGGVRLRAPESAGGDQRADRGPRAAF